MILFPAVDILNNNAVRLLQGDKAKVTIYGKPLDYALKWKSLGAQYLHMVDLNAAFDGDTSVNQDTILNITKNLNVPIQVGGGIRSIQIIEKYIEKLNVSRVILGTIAIENPKLVEQAVKLYGDKIVVGIDCKADKVVIKGWVKNSGQTSVELAKKMADIGVSSIVYTDVARDGALVGVNISQTKKIQDETGLNVIASGGVSGLENIKALAENKIYGAILGKALYAGNLNFKEALEIALC